MSFSQHYVSEHRTKLVALCIIALLLGASILLQAYSIVQIIDTVFIEQLAFRETFRYFGLFLAAIVLRLFMQHVLGRIGGSFAAAVKTSIRQRLLKQWASSAVEQHVAFETGEKVTLFIDTVEQLESYYREYIPQLIKTMVVPIMILVTIFIVHPNSGWIMLVTAPFVPITYIIIGMQTQKKSEDQLDALNRFSGKFLDLLQGLQTIRLFGQAKKQQAILAESNEGFMTRTLSVLKIAFASTLFIELIATLGIGLVALEIGFQMIVFKTLTFAPAFLVLTLAPEYYNSLKELGAAFHTGRGSLGAATLIEEQLNERQQAVHWGQEALQKQPTIELVDATFRYDTGTTIGPLSLTIKPMQTVALVGKTGHGKTTMLNMLSSLSELSTGKILLNGQPRENINSEDWYVQMSYISQHPYVFAGTIRDNICMGTPAADNEVFEALERTQLSDWVNRLPNGLDTAIGEGGIGLSGGEKQRLAIARAFLKQPSIVFFDEPTAGLDVMTEQLLMKAIEELRKTATVIIAAHRFESIRQANYMYVIEDGQIIAKGTHHELQQHPFYQQMAERNDAACNSYYE